MRKALFIWASILFALNFVWSLTLWSNQSFWITTIILTVLCPLRWDLAIKIKGYQIKQGHHPES